SARRGQGRLLPPGEGDQLLLQGPHRAGHPGRAAGGARALRPREARHRRGDRRGLQHPGREDAHALSRHRPGVMHGASDGPRGRQLSFGARLRLRRGVDGADDRTEARPGTVRRILEDLDWNPEDGGSFERMLARLTLDTNGVRGDEEGFDPTSIARYGLAADPGI